MEKTYDVITIGSATRDVFMQISALHTHRASDAINHLEASLPYGAKIDIDNIVLETGGGANNNATTFARLGKFKTAALARIGSDTEGEAILKALKTDHIDSSLVQITNKEHTAYSSILYHGGAQAERTILVHRGASSQFEHEKIPWEKLQAKWFYISSLGGDLVLLRQILLHAKKINAQVALNPGGQELSQPVFSALLTSAAKHVLSFLIVNREEAAQLTGVRFEETKELLHMLSRIAGSAIMTDGPKGAYAVLGPQQTAHSRQLEPRAVSRKLAAYFIPSAGSTPKNLTGAGDAFGSGFLTGWIKSKGDIQEALRVGTLNADSVVKHIGAKVGILKTYPSKKQLSSLPVKPIRF